MRNVGGHRPVFGRKKAQKKDRLYVVEGANDWTVGRRLWAEAVGQPYYLSP